MALWGGRFEKGVDAFTQEFGASLEVVVGPGRDLAVDDLLGHPAPEQDRVAFDTIVNQDDLVSAVGGPFTPATVNLVRALRGMGAT